MARSLAGVFFFFSSVTRGETVLVEAFDRRYLWNDIWEFDGRNWWNKVLDRTLPFSRV